ncbi:LysR family transcriptional regulator [Ruegeria faecimaris]|uniref:LysR family transcriptional regulator n=1 Tax=Ruegeria faecimaris TaxID=686389 RepID=UPI002492B02A|nr:LysR family transcriptional regulator [Ruegeria faecimaris]
MIDSKAIDAVRSLARHGNFRVAADAIGTSPASFSRYIGQAETYAGQALFERTGRGATIRPAGKRFLQLLDALHNATSQFEAGVKRLRSVDPEVLNIGCGPLTTRTIITPLLAELLDNWPDLRVRVDVRATMEPLEALRIGRLDVAVCDLTHTPNLSDLDIQVVRKEPVFFCARPDHPIHQATPVSIAEVFRHPFITAHMHRHWRSAIAATLGNDEKAWHIVDRLPQIESDDFSLVADMACRADLIAGGMKEDFDQHLKLGMLKEIRTTQPLTWNICAARRKGVKFAALDMFWNRLCHRYGAE